MKKLFNQIIKEVKEEYKFLIFILVILILLSIRFPYYIDAPGGITDMSTKINIDGYKSKGTFNLTYVKEYKATIPTLIVSLFNKDYKIIKEEDIMLENEDYKLYEKRDKLFMEEAISNAIYVAYTKANKKIDIKENDIIVTYILPEANTNLKVGDKILSINNQKINEKENITKVLNSLNVNEKINIEILRKNKRYNKYAYVIKDDNKNCIGLIISNIKKYNTTPKLEVKTNKKESGSSGGLVTALSIYNSLVPNDITKGKTIVVTGTIDLDGNVGSIGGIEYKLKSAVKSKADLFIVPQGENYKEAIKLKKKNHYKIKIIGVSAFDEAIDYLKSN